MRRRWRVHRNVLGLSEAIEFQNNMRGPNWTDAIDSNRDIHFKTHEIFLRLLRCNSIGNMPCIRDKAADDDDDHENYDHNDEQSAIKQHAKLILSHDSAFIYLLVRNLRSYVFLYLFHVFFLFIIFCAASKRVSKRLTYVFKNS